MDTDVLVVGAGPTGLMLANQLVRRGVRTRIVERNAHPARETRALGVQARTLEIYRHLGIDEKAIALGRRATGADMWSLGRRAARVPLFDAGRLTSPYPYLLILGQDDNEKLLGEKLTEAGLAVEWSTELVAIAQEADRVVAKLRRADGKESDVTARWVAGCDGSRSTVRELSGIEFVGAAYEHVFYVADTRMTGPMVPDEVNIYLWVGGFHLFFPMRGENHWRIVGILPPALRGRDDLTLDEVFPAIREQAGAGIELEDCSWFATYRIHHRLAARFRDRRCFHLGDAAHIHSPVGAQGMNTGLQDAYNLAWKLALVASGAADDALLDSYAAERMPVAGRLLSTTDRLFTFIVSENNFAGAIRTRILPRFLALAMSIGPIRKFAFRTISQTGIHYREGPLSENLDGLPSGAPRAGDRFPWLRLEFESGTPVEDLYDEMDDTRMELLVFGQPAPEGSLGLAAFGDLLRIHAFPETPANARELDAAGIPRPSFYLVRPDGYVGLCGRRFEAESLGRYLSERLCIRPTTNAGE